MVSIEAGRRRAEGLMVLKWGRGIFQGGPGWRDDLGDARGIQFKGAQNTQDSPEWQDFLVSAH